MHGKREGRVGVFWEFRKIGGGILEAISFNLILKEKIKQAMKSLKFTLMEGRVTTLAWG